MRLSPDLRLFAAIAVVTTARIVATSGGAGDRGHQWWSARWRSGGGLEHHRCQGCLFLARAQVRAEASLRSACTTRSHRHHVLGLQPLLPPDPWLSATPVRENPTPPPGSWPIGCQAAALGRRCPHRQAYFAACAGCAMAEIFFSFKLFFNLILKITHPDKYL